jgi:3-O-methylgallate 3,4-dioxygenase
MPIVAAFGSSHSTMQFAALEHWLERFDHVDVKAPLFAPDGEPVSYAALLAREAPRAKTLMSKAAIAERFAATMAAQAALREAIEGARLDALVVIGDDQRELFHDACRPAIAVYYGDTIRNAAQPAAPPDDWYQRAGLRRRPQGADMHYPCHAALGRHLIEGLGARGFDVTAVQSLVGEQSEGHAYNSIQSLYLAGRPVPIVPIMLNTYYPPNQPTPARSLDLGIAIGELVDEFSGAARVGIMASGGLSHFTVLEELDGEVIAALRRKDLGFLAGIDPKRLRGGTSEIRNWICAAGAVRKLDLGWVEYVAGYRSSALTGVGLCFAHWS